MIFRPDPKPETDRSKLYTEWLKTQPCVACGRYRSDQLDVVPSHKGGGVSIKGDDFEALPLCTGCHTGISPVMPYPEHLGQKTFWLMIEINTGKSREQHAKDHRERYKEWISPKPN